MDLEQKEHEQIKIAEVSDDLGPTPEPQPDESGIVHLDPLIGSDFENRYHIESLLGKGATGSVYKAVDRKKNLVVAIKILHSHLATDSAIAKRFKQEAKTSSLLQHPNIAEVLEYNKTENGTPYLVIEYVEGTSLFDAIQAAGWLPVSKVLTISMQICAALSVAHEKGIIHRDLKPSNIILSKGPDGNVLIKVLDFGIAKVLPAQGDTLFKLTQTGETLGSLLYMSPEQCLDQDVDARSDCYSLGCVMYEALTGKPPLAARTAFETMNKHMTEMPERLERVRPDVSWPDGLKEVLFKSLAKEPGKRYQRILDLQDDIKSLLTGSGQPNRQDCELAGDARIAEKRPADYRGDQGQDSLGQDADVYSFESVERFVEAKRPFEAEFAELNAKPRILSLMLMIVGLLVFCAVFPSPAIFLIVGSLVVITSFAAIFLCFLISMNGKVRAEQQTLYERLKRQLDSLRCAEQRRMLLTGGAWSVDHTAASGPIFVIEQVKSIRGEQLIFKGLKTIPVDRNEKIWDNIGSLSKWGELAPPYALPLEIGVYIDEAGKPIAICVKGKFALVL